MKVSFTNLKLKVDNSVKKFNFKDTEIEILNYLPVEDRYALIMLTLQKSKEEKTYNSVKLDTYFHLFLIYSYTNLSFTDKQKENELEIYDKLKSNGFIEAFLANFNEREYNELISLMEEEVENQMRYNLSTSGIVSQLINDLPKQAEAMKDILDSFDKNKFEEVVNFAAAVNNGKNI